MPTDRCPDPSHRLLCGRPYGAHHRASLPHLGPRGRACDLADLVWRRLVGLVSAWHPARRGVVSPILPAVVLSLGLDACFPSFPDDCFERGCPEGSFCSSSGLCEAIEPDPLELLSVEPVPHAVAGDASVLRARFTRPMQAADATRFVARSSVDGIWTGSYGGAGTPVLTFAPQSVTSAGVQVEVTLLGSLQSETGEALVRPAVHRFWVRTAPSGRGFTGSPPLPVDAGGLRAPQVVNLDEDAELEVVAGAGMDLDTVRIADITPEGMVQLRGLAAVSRTSVADLAVGDLDGDGRRDLLVASPEPGENRPYRQRALGVFQGGPVLALSSGLDRIRLGDLDGDGDLDLAASIRALEQGPGRNLVVGRGSGDATFAIASPVDSGAGGARAIAIELADMDGDLDLDLVVLNAGSVTGGPPSTVAVLMNDGEGRFALPPNDARPEVGSGTVALAVGDFDGDGDADVVVGSPVEGTLTTLLNDGAGRLSIEGQVPAEDVGILAAGDVDGDGDLDLVAQGGRLLLNGPGSDRWTVGPGVGMAGTPVLADVDADRDLDLVLSGGGRDGSLRVWRND